MSSNLPTLILDVTFQNDTFTLEEKKKCKKKQKKKDKQENTNIYMYSAGYDVNGTIAKKKEELFERNYKYCIIFFYFIGMLCCVFCKYGF